MTRMQLTALVFALAAVWAGVLWWRGIDISLTMLAPLTLVAGIGFTLIQLFDKYVWRCQWLHPWFVHQPMIEGTWRGTLVSDYKNPATGEPIPPIVAFLRVRQTFTSVHIRLMTAESSSDLKAGKVYCNQDETFAVAGIYLNTPRQEIQHRSPVHYGGLMLVIEGDPGRRLEGNYWTSRKTTGSLVFDNKIDRLCDSFAEAHDATGAAAAMAPPAPASPPGARTGSSGGGTG